MELATRPSEFPFNWEEFWGFFDQDENGLPIIKEIDKDASTNELPPDLVKEIQEARQRTGAIESASLNGDGSEDSRALE